jgi:CheY-like chemotaxis protein
MIGSRMVVSADGVRGENSDLSGLRILVVEDNADCANSEAMLLRLLGHEVEVAHDGPMAVELAKRQEPDVVLLDIGLPGIDGWAVAQLIQEQATGKRPFVIAITGFGQKEDIRNSTYVGIDLHLVKPVEPDYLKAVLRRFQRVIR